MVKNDGVSPGEQQSGMSRKELLLGALEQYESRLTAYANRLLRGDLDRARDVVQHAFLKLCQQPIANIQHKLAAWLYTVVRNRIVDDHRAANSSEQSLDFDTCDQTENDPAEQVQQIEFLRLLRRLMIDLPDSQREVIDLWSHGFSTNEIANITGTTAGAVRVCLHRGIRTLKSRPAVIRWLNGESKSSSSAETDHGKSKKPSRATGFDATPVGLDSIRSASTSAEKVESKINGNHVSRVSLPGKLS